MTFRPPTSVPPRSCQGPGRTTFRAGYTLVELLVVMIIMVILVATALPLVKRVMDNDRVREGSRSLSAYINMVKTRATQTGRPCGLLFVLQTPLGASAASATVAPNPPQYVRQCTQLFLVEVPPPYQGSTLDARARIRQSLTIPPPPPGTPPVYEFYPLYYNSTAMMPGYEPDTSELQYLYTLIAPGEQFLVRFEHKGAWYVCQRGNSLTLPFPYDDDLKFIYTGNTAPSSVQKYWVGGTAVSDLPLAPGFLDTASSPSSNPGYHYQIMRSPKPVGEPMELTGGTCIDMTYSGAGPTGNGFIQANNALGILFSSSGGVQRRLFRQRPARAARRHDPPAARPREQDESAGRPERG